MRPSFSQPFSWAPVSGRCSPPPIKHYFNIVLGMLTPLSQRRGDMHRWNDFPGLGAAVKQVDGISWSDLQGRGIPGRAVKYDIPKFDDGPTVSNAKATKSDDVATGPANNGESVRNNIRDEVEDELEEGEIKEIKKEIKDEPGLSLDIAPQDRLSQPESVTPNHQLQPTPHQHSYPYQACFGHHLPGVPFQWMPHHYYQPSSTHFYPFMPYYNVAFLPFGTDSSSRHGGADPQIPHGAIYPQSHAFPHHFVASTPETYFRAPSPPPSLPPASFPRPNSTLPSEPSAPRKPPSAPPCTPAKAKKPDSQQREKRKFSISTDPSTSVPSRRPKRRRPVASDFMSDSEGHEDHRTKHALLANGVPDFGAWFQKQVTGSKKKLSHLEHTSLPIGSLNSKGS